MGMVAPPTPPDPLADDERLALAMTTWRAEQGRWEIGTVSRNSNAPVFVYLGDSEDPVYGPAHYQACKDWIDRRAAQAVLKALGI